MRARDNKNVIARVRAHTHAHTYISIMLISITRLTKIYYVISRPIYSFMYDCCMFKENEYYLLCIAQSGVHLHNFKSSGLECIA